MDHAIGPTDVADWPIMRPGRGIQNPGGGGPAGQGRRIGSETHSLAIQAGGAVPSHVASTQVFRQHPRVTGEVCLFQPWRQNWERKKAVFDAKTRPIWVNSDGSVDGTPCPSFVRRGSSRVDEPEGESEDHTLSSPPIPVVARGNSRDHNKGFDTILFEESGILPKSRELFFYPRPEKRRDSQGSDQPGRAQASPSVPIPSFVRIGVMIPDSSCFTILASPSRVAWVAAALDPCPSDAGVARPVAQAAAATRSAQCSAAPIRKSRRRGGQGLCAGTCQLVTKHRSGPHISEDAHPQVAE